MDKPYISYSKEDPKGASALFALLADTSYRLHREKEVEERRQEQVLVSSIRVISPRISVEKVICDGVACEWVRKRRRPERERVIVYFHGGGWAFGSLESARPVSVQMAENSNFSVLMVEYRLSPENPFPAGLEDCYKVYRWLLNSGYKAEQIGLFGDSAGGNLSFALLHKLRDESVALPACVGAASPATDLSHDSVIDQSDDDLIFTQYHGESRNIFDLYVMDDDNDRKDPYLSPIYGDLSGFPPILIHSGGNEPIAQDNIHFVEKAVSSGVNATLKLWKGMFHDFSIVGISLKESRESMKELGQFFKKHIAKL